MPTFGEYETIGEALATTEERGHVTTVWRARKSASLKAGAYLIKCYAPRRQRLRQGQPEDALQEDRALEFLAGIKDLKKAHSKGARCLAPIHDLGLAPEGAWYATDFYERRTLQEFIVKHGTPDTAMLRHIVHSVVTGCLELRRSRAVAKYSHGNLKPSNVLLAGKKQPLRKTPLHLTDPHPSPLQLSTLEVDDQRAVGELLTEVVEVQDLRAIGELIFQLVEGRLLSRQGDYNYPVARSPRWDRLGKNGEFWRDLCNRLLDPNLSLAKENLEKLERAVRPSVVLAKLPTILMLAGGLGLLVGGVWLGRSFIEQRRQEQYRGHFSSALKALGATNLEQGVSIVATRTAPVPSASLLGARHEIDLALRFGKGACEAVELKTNIEARAEFEYDQVCKAAEEEVRNRDLAGASTRVTLALALKPDGDRAKKLQAGIAELRGCDAAKEAARETEERNDWPGALSKWQAAQAACGGVADQEIKHGLDFAEAMRSAQDALKQAQAKANTAPHEATNLCARVLAELGGLERLATIAGRSNAIGALTKQVKEAREVAAAAITRQGLAALCDAAKATARKAEASKVWSGAFSRWQEAKAACGQGPDPEISGGMQFARAMTNAQELLRHALAEENSAPQKATNLCAQVLAELNGVRALATTQTRKDTVTTLTTQVTEVTAAAVAVITRHGRVKLCELAQKTAREAELSNDWAKTFSKWQEAEIACGRAAVSEVRDGMTFASAITNAQDALSRAQAKTNTAPQAATNLCEQILTQLKRVQGSATNMARSHALTALTKQAREVRDVAVALISRGDKAALCDTAKQDARKIEGDNNWPVTLSKWQAAQAACGGVADQEITNGIYFAQTIINAQGVLKQAQDEIKSAPEAATNLCGQVLAKLRGVQGLAAAKARENALRILQAQAQVLSAEALTRIGGQARVTQCGLAKQAAVAAEAGNNWPNVLSKWQAAQAACGAATDQEITNGIYFAQTMTDALGVLKQAQARVESAPREVTNLCAQVLARLQKVRGLAAAQVRTSALGTLQDQAEALSRQAARLSSRPESAPPLAATNLFGIEFVWVPGIGTNKAGAYVEVTELSASQLSNLRSKCGWQPSTPLTTFFLDGQLSNGDFPAEFASFQDATKFLAALNQLPENRAANRRFRLLAADDYRTLAGREQLSEDDLKSLKAEDKEYVGKTGVGINPPRKATQKRTAANGLSDVIGNLVEWTSEGKLFGVPYWAERPAKLLNSIDQRGVINVEYDVGLRLAFEQ
jgi:hypothetical protein